MKGLVYLMFLTFLFMMSSGCALLESKTLVTGLASFLGCSTLGAAVSPKGINSEYSAGFLGFACATGSMAAVEYYDLVRTKRSDKEILHKLRSKDFKNEVSIRKSLLRSKGFKNLDPNMKEKLQGNWSIYKINNWILDNGRLLHEDLEIKFNK